MKTTKKHGREAESNKHGSSASIFLLVLIAITLAVTFYLLLQTEPTAEESSLQPLLFSIIGVTVLALILCFAWEFSAANRLRKALNKISPRINQVSIEAVKKEYLRIYGLYMKLSEKKKQNFYAKVNSLRENLEEQMQNEKELDRLLQEEVRGSIDEQKKKYLQMYALYEKLPRQLQEQYYPKIVQLRDRLERGN